MELNSRQKEYVLKILNLNLGSDSTITKVDIVRFAEDLGLKFKKNISKTNLIELILSEGYEKQFFNAFAEFISVPYWEIHKQYNLSYKQIHELEQLGVIEKLDQTNKNNDTLYPLDVLKWDEGELLKVWNNKYKTDFYKIRIEIKSTDEFQKLVNELSKIFEIENVSKPYPHREQSGYYCYLSIRPYNQEVNNNDYKNEENARLKTENGVLRGKIEALETRVKELKHAGTV